MKNIFRVVGFGLAIVAFSAINGFAQTANSCEDAYEVKDGEYKKFRELIKTPVTLEKAKSALQVGESFNTKYAECEDTKPVVEYIKGKIPAIKDFIRITERNNKFDNGVKTKNWSDAFSAGKQIVSEEAAKPVSLDVALTLAQIGYDRAYEKNDTYNADATAMAQTAIQKLESGMVSTTFGLFAYPLKNKENALGWMNYIIGYVKFIRQNDQKGALANFYKAAAKHNSDVKNFAELYQMLGIYYFTEVQKIDAERVKKFEANGNKENEETLAMWDLEKGYFERAIDAYARAHKIATASETTAKPERKPAAKAYKDGLYKDLQGLYQERFDKLDGLDKFIAAQLAKPLPDPTSEVQPIKEVVPTTTTTSTTTNPTTKPTNTTTKPTTNPSNTTTKPTTNTTKPTTNTTKPSGSTKTKPTTKKKSGR